MEKRMKRRHITSMAYRLITRNALRILLLITHINENVSPKRS